MRTLCRPGDLAMIIKDEPGLEVNVGRVVHVGRSAGLDPATGAQWHITPATDAPYPYISRLGSIAVGNPPPATIIHPDKWLMPMQSREKNRQAVAQGDAQPVAIS